MKSSGPPEKCRQAALACRPLACSFCLPVESISSFYPLLVQGFFVPIKAGCSIREFLCDRLGWDVEYIHQRIQTIFLEGRLVDDINRAIVKDGASLAVSGAMPGVLGAMVRKGSYYSAMRSHITDDDKDSVLGQSEGRVKVKLFNVIAKEKARALFDMGIIMLGKDIKSYIMKLPESYLAQCKKVRIDKKPTDIYQLLSSGLEEREVFLKIHRCD